MNVFYEEEGAFRTGAVLADNNTSLQVEAPHGKRSKVKSSSVLLRFESPPLARFMGDAQQVADAIDVDFLWQCCGPDEFSYEALASEYFGHAPNAVEAAGVLITLHGAPMYFYRKGRGRYRAAPPEALKAALAGAERRRIEVERRERYTAELIAFRLPGDFKPVLGELLYRPDKAGAPWKALDAACASLKLTPARLLERCGAITSPRDYHLNRFLFDHFPRGTGFGDMPPVAAPADLPTAEAAAFSIDDAATTEIDDGFSLERLHSGNWRIGIHIAAPALGVTPGSVADRAARERLSTVYHPGAKITMLPEQAIDSFTLAEGRACPALSLYVEATPGFEVVSTASRVERIRVAENLRHDDLEAVFNDQALAAGAIDHPRGSELRALWEFAARLGRNRRGDAPEPLQRQEFVFRIEGERVTIVPRRRGSPVDRTVSELMIFANSEWGRQLAAAGAAAIYRVQGSGKVRMSTVPAAHDGLGVDQYIWASSPLRRYVDLVNQRQLIALARGESPPYGARDESLLAAMRDFEIAYDAYGDFQRTMERYWCLRWLIQEDRATVTGSVIRENIVRLGELPLTVRVPSLPVLDSGSEVELAVGSIDLLELTLHCEFRGRRQSTPNAGTGDA